LHGLVNKNMMTVVLKNATRLARYIDEVLVGILDHADMFKEEAIVSNQLDTRNAIREYRPASTAYPGVAWR
jgi:hypothetical protein